jgi:DNA-binding IclR family transcriptional regulator
VSSVQSIERAFDILAALATGPQGVTAIANRCHLPKSTVVRLLRALQAEEAVEQSPEDGRYRLGPRIRTLAAGLRPVRRLVAVAHPVLEELAAHTGEAAGLSVPEGWQMQYVDQVDAPNPVQVRDWTGSRIPMHAISSGQVVLAFLPGPVVARFLATPLERFTPATITDATALLERLRQVRRDGCAWVRDEFATGISSVAAPVAGVDGEVVAAVHVHGPSYRFPAPGREPAVAEAVIAAAARIGGLLRS